MIFFPSCPLEWKRIKQNTKIPRTRKFEKRLQGVLDSYSKVRWNGRHILGNGIKANGSRGNKRAGYESGKADSLMQPHSHTVAEYWLS